MNGIGQSRARAKEKILAHALNPVREHVTASLVHTHCQAVEHAWRDCLYNPVLTLLACVWKQLRAASARQTEDWIGTLSDGALAGRNDGKDFCAARQRLPAFVFRQVMRQVGQTASVQAGYCFKQLPVWIVDGTTLRTPNSAENDAAFGRSRNQTRSSRSPILRLALLVCAGCGAILSTAIGRYDSSEWELFLQMLGELPAGGLLLADRAYSSFLLFALMQQRGSYVLTRHNSKRKGWRLKRHARGDELHEWSRPKLAQVTRPELLAQCPDTLQVRILTQCIQRRGYRSWKLQVATTLLDPVRYPAADLIDLYLQRWDIEQDLRTLKTNYGMARLSGKTPDIIYKEIYSIMLAHNCVLAIMSESGQTPRTLSHTRARQLVLIFAERMVEASTLRLPTLYQHLLARIAMARLDKRERLPQPRAIIQRPSTYPVLLTSRAAWRHAQHAA